MSHKLHDPNFPLKKHVEENSVNVDGMGCEKNDVNFFNQVHWIPNQQQAFKNLYMIS